tara:strand:- start:451 stop:627 length:177 start_codon:yes stop_codon:yes gene_type:complete
VRKMENQQSTTSKREGLIFLAVLLIMIGPIVGANIFYRGKGRWTDAGGYLHYIEAMIK